MTEPERLTSEDLWPRDDPAYRFRVYRRDADNGLSVLCACADPTSVGVAICTLAEEGEQPVGVLDVQPGGLVCDTGVWVVNPYSKPA